MPYFAGVKSSEIGVKICSRLKEIGDWTYSRKGQERRDKYREAYFHHYGFEMGMGSTSHLQREGEQEELVRSRNNKARTNVKAHIGLLLGPKFTWRPQASAKQTSARAAVTLSANILEWYWKQQQMMDYFSEMAETADVFAEGHIHAPWEMRGGPSLPLGEEGAPVGMGDLRFYNILPWHVFRDDERTSYKNLDWLCIVNPDANPYDLEALYPQTADGEPTKDKLANSKGPDFFNLNWERTQQSDSVPLVYFYHRPTPALPSGRQVLFINSETVLEDGPLQYDNFPVVRYAADEQLGTAYGYTSHWDALGQQEVLDDLHSAAVTNETMLARQGIMMEEGTAFSGEEVNGMKVFRFPRGGRPPEAMQLTATPKEVFEHMNTIKSDMRDILGMNDVSMGQPETAQMNAEAFAILKSSAIERNSPAQQRLLDCASRLGTHVINTVKRHVPKDAPRSVPVTLGIQGATMSEMSYVGADLEAIGSVIVTVGNPLEQTPSGRFQIARFLLEAGLLKDPEQIQQVLETGRLEPVTDPIRRASLYVDRENEMLQEGESPTVALTDDVFKHVLHHKCVLDDPEARRNPEVINATVAHINEHIRVYLGLPDPAATPLMPGQPPPPDVTMDPRYLPILRGALGQQPPPPDPSQTPPPMPGEQSGTPPPQQGSPSSSGPPAQSPTDAMQPPQAGGQSTSPEAAPLPV